MNDLKKQIEDIILKQLNKCEYCREKEEFNINVQDVEEWLRDILKVIESLNVSDYVKKEDIIKYANEYGNKIKVHPSVGGIAPVTMKRAKSINKKDFITWLNNL